MPSRSGARGLPDRLVLLALGVAILTSGVVLVGFGSHLGFIADDWEILFGRGGWSPDALLAPYHGNVLFGSAVVYKLLLAAFGMGSSLPFYLVSTLLFLLSVVLLFIYLRTRVGDWPALIGVVPILFLGAAHEDLLWSFQMCFFGAMCAGLGTLIALDRESTAADRVACGLLLCSLAFSSLGIAFAAAAAVSVAWGRRPVGSRLYLIFVPIAAYGLWWLGWGHAGGNQATLHNLTDLAGLGRFVFDAAAAGVTSLLGLMTMRRGPYQSPVLCEVLLVAGLLAVAVRVVRRRSLSRGLAVALALALAFWVTIALARTPDRLPTASRYQYPSAIFVLLIAGEAVRGIQLRRTVVVALAAAALAAAYGGFALLRVEYKHPWKASVDELRSSLTGVEIAGRAARPGFRVVLPPAVNIPVWDYLATIREHGAPGFSEPELRARAEPERVRADASLAAALGLHLTSKRPPPPTLDCRTPAGTSTILRPGSYTVTNLGPGPMQLLLGRFADVPSVELGTLRPHSGASLRIPADESTTRWRLAASRPDRLRLCMTSRSP